MRRLLSAYELLNFYRIKMEEKAPKKDSVASICRSRIYLSRIEEAVLALAGIYFWPIFTTVFGFSLRLSHKAGS